VAAQKRLRRRADDHRQRRRRVVQDGTTSHTYDFIANCEDEYGEPASPANVRLILAAPDHALICWAMCVQDGRWEEWTPYDGSGEFVFAGLRYATRVDEFGCPKLTPALRMAITQSQLVGA
jgi:hypothetical protein